jgi:hypothetical protein
VTEAQVRSLRRCCLAFNQEACWLNPLQGGVVPWPPAGMQLLPQQAQPGSLQLQDMGTGQGSGQGGSLNVRELGEP